MNVRLLSRLYYFILFASLLVMEVALIDALLYVPLTIPIVGMYRYYENIIVASITTHFIEIILLHFYF